MKYLPVYLNMADKNILVIGGGDVARQKLETILKFTDNVSIVTKAITEQVKSLGVPFTISEYTKKFLKNIDIVYACTNNRKVNQAIKSDAKSENILVNVVDDPDLCDFISPAVYTDEMFSVAVSTFGYSPSGAAHIRNQIKAHLPADELNAFVSERHRNRKKKAS